MRLTSRIFSRRPAADVRLELLGDLLGGVPRLLVLRAAREVDDLADRHEAADAAVDNEATLVVVDDGRLDDDSRLELLLHRAPLALEAGASERQDDMSFGRLGLEHVDQDRVADVEGRGGLGVSAVQLAVADHALALGPDVDEDLVAVDANDGSLDDVTVLEAADVGVLLGEKLGHRGRLRSRGRGRFGLGLGRGRIGKLCRQHVGLDDELGFDRGLLGCRGSVVRGRHRRLLGCRGGFVGCHRRLLGCRGDFVGGLRPAPPRLAPGCCRLPRRRRPPRSPRPRAPRRPRPPRCPRPPRPPDRPSPLPQGASAGASCAAGSGVVVCCCSSVKGSCSWSGFRPETRATAEPRSSRRLVPGCGPCAVRAVRPSGGVGRVGSSAVAPLGPRESSTGVWPVQSGACPSCPTSRSSPTSSARRSPAGP